MRGEASRDIFRSEVPGGHDLVGLEDFHHEVVNEHVRLVTCPCLVSTDNLQKVVKNEGFLGRRLSHKKGVRGTFG